MSPPAGEVWLADLGLTAKTRPVVILSREDANAPRDLAIYVPLTTQYRGSRYEVALPKLNFLREESTANVPVPRLQYKIGNVSQGVLDQIREALRFALNMEEETGVIATRRASCANLAAAETGMRRHSRANTRGAPMTLVPQL